MANSIQFFSYRRNTLLHTILDTHAVKQVSKYPPYWGEIMLWDKTNFNRTKMRKFHKLKIRHP